MLLSEIFNEKYEFEEVSVEEEGVEEEGMAYKIVNNGKMIMNKLSLGEAILFAQKLGRNVCADYKRYHEEQLNFEKGNFKKNDK